MKKKKKRPKDRRKIGFLTPVESATLKVPLVRFFEFLATATFVWLREAFAIAGPSGLSGRLAVGLRWFWGYCSFLIPAGYK